MSESSSSRLATRLSRTIARRQRLARWGKALVVPTFAAAFYATRWSQWLALAGFLLFVVEVVAVLLGEAQRCPRCDASLVTGRGWGEQFEGTCPDCGFLID